MPRDRVERPNGPIDLRDLARKMLLELLEPLTGVVLGSGLSVSELTAIMRLASVRAVAARQLEVAGRINISGISASTGIPRSEISRLLRRCEQRAEDRQDRLRSSTGRVLSAWSSDRRFRSQDGNAAHLRIYGRGSSFEALAKAHARGTPIRALLDELAQVGAVEVAPSQVVKLKRTALKQRRANRQAIKAYGDTATAIIDSMLKAMRGTGGLTAPPSATAVNSAREKEMAALVIRFLIAGGSDAVNNLQNHLNHELGRSRPARLLSKSKRIGLLILLYQHREKSESKNRPLPSRRNLKRNSFS